MLNPMPPCDCVVTNLFPSPGICHELHRQSLCRLQRTQPAPAISSCNTHFETPVRQEIQLPFGFPGSLPPFQYHGVPKCGFHLVAFSTKPAGGGLSVRPSSGDLLQQITRCFRIISKSVIQHLRHVQRTRWSPESSGHATGE